MSMAYDELKKYRERRRKNTSGVRITRTSWELSSIGAVVGLAGGIVAAIFGSTFTAIAWFTQTDSIVNTLGTVLLFLTIPLLVLGAHCLDLTDKKRKREKESRFHETD